MTQLPSFLPALFDAFGNQSADVRKVRSPILSFSIFSDKCVISVIYFDVRLHVILCIMTQLSCIHIFLFYAFFTERRIGIYIERELCLRLSRW